MNDELITPESDFQETQQREHTRPAFTFKGKELAPWSQKRITLYNMVMSDRDLVGFDVVKILFVLEYFCPRREVTKAVWGDIHEFRERIGDLQDTLTDEDMKEANRIVNEIVEAERKTRVIAEPETDGKKNEGVT